MTLHTLDWQFAKFISKPALSKASLDSFQHTLYIKKIYRADPLNIEPCHVSRQRTLFATMSGQSAICRYLQTYVVLIKISRQTFFKFTFFSGRRFSQGIMRHKFKSRPRSQKQKYKTAQLTAVILTSLT